jgi:hypothetical protein
MTLFELIRARGCRAGQARALYRQAAGSGADIADVNGGEGLPRPDVWVVMRTARFASGLL